MGKTVRIPFYDGGGAYVLTLTIGLDADGQPPGHAEVIRPDHTGARVHTRYRLDQRPEGRPPLRYIETCQPRAARYPIAGSDDAAHRVQNARPWPLPRAPIGYPDTAGGGPPSAS